MGEFHDERVSSTLVILPGACQSDRMRFRLFGVPVTIQGWFWVSTLLLWGIGSSRTSFATLPIWVGIVLVSILVHELGHAAAMLRHGIRPSITLHGMGGVTVSEGGASWHRLGRADRIVVSLAGPFAGFVLGGVILAAERLIPHDPLPWLAAFTLGQLVWVNIGWGLINLAPVLPFDGGHVLEDALGPRRSRTAAIVSLVCGGLLALYFASSGQVWGAILFGMSAFQSYQRLQMQPGAVIGESFMSPSASSTGPGPLRRWWLKLRLRRLQAQNEALRRAGARRASGPALRVIKGGADDEPPKDKRYLN